MTYAASGGRVSTGNSSATPLAGGATFTGAWENVTNYASITVKGLADQAGTLYADFSADGVTTLDSPQLSAGTSGAFSFHNLVPASAFFRIRLVNGATPQGSLSLQTIYYVGAKASLPTSRLGQSVSQFSDILNIRTANDVALDTSRGGIGGRTALYKFGANPAVAGTSTEAVSLLGTLNLLTAATTVRVKAGGNANDTAAGSGARTVTVVGLNSSWVETSDVLTLAGASASAAGVVSFIRIYRAYVETSGTYATLGAGANTGQITIENSGGGTDLLDIAAGFGQTQYAAYTIPAGKTGYLVNASATVESVKPMNLSLFQRRSADDVTSPYSAKRLVMTFAGLTGYAQRSFTNFYPSFPARTDLWWEVNNPGGTAGSCSADFGLTLVDD
jgi:hypothetical protein